jgi:hypothetical protein
VLAHLHTPVLGVRVKLTQAARPADRPASAVASVNLNGRPVRAQVSAATMKEAIDLLKERLASRLARISGRKEAIWRVPEPLRGHQRRRLPAPERRVARRKSVPLVPRTLDEAAYDMEAMDFDFLFFADTTSGRGHVLYLRHDGHYVLITPA